MKGQDPKRLRLLARRELRELVKDAERTAGALRLDGAGIARREPIMARTATYGGRRIG